MYSKTTNGITVSVEPSYLEDQSSPENNQYVWAYRITIENRGNEPARLRSRYWRITDANGVMQEVEGDGVVGEQPLLRPGETFQYTSGAPLGAPGGIMVGTYRMEGQDGRVFTVDIPAFSLDSPYQHSMIH